ncbi:MAG: hypothetical protein V3V02_08445 [Rhizobiaceae bacterium]
MTISKDLMLAILSMDSYNRGYGAGIKGLSQAKGTQIGTATINKNAEEALLQGSAKTAGFYAASYTLSSGETVISYRGTDNFSANDVQGGNDILNGWTSALFNVSENSQSNLALKFYSAVTGKQYEDGPAANTILTGHSAPLTAQTASP